MKLIQDAFDAAFAEQGVGGMSCTVIVNGQVVFDRCVGTVRENSLVHTWSSIKPVTAATLILTALEHGVSLDTPVETIWPELKGVRNSSLTIAGVLAHRAGYASVPFDGDATRLVDADAVEAALHRQTPDWTPGTAVGEHAMTYGNVVGGLVRRIGGRSLGETLRARLAEPFGLDLHVGVAAADLPRVVDLEMPEGWWERLTAPPAPYLPSAFGNGISAELVNSTTWRKAEIGAVNGHTNSRALAGFWALVLDGTLPSEIVTPYGPEEYDLVIGQPATWTLGSAQTDANETGMGGVGGSYGGIRPRLGLAWAFIPTFMGSADRVIRIEEAILETLGG